MTQPGAAVTCNGVFTLSHNSDTPRQGQLCAPAGRREPDTSYNHQHYNHHYQPAAGGCVVWSVFGQCLASIWSVFGQCLVSVWSVFGQCLVRVWPVFGRCLVVGIQPHARLEMKQPLASYPQPRETAELGSHPCKDSLGRLCQCRKGRISSRLGRGGNRAAETTIRRGETELGRVLLGRDTTRGTGKTAATARKRSIRTKNMQTNKKHETKKDNPKTKTSSKTRHWRTRMATRSAARSLNAGV